jgi:hypothetical protein
MGLIDTEEAAKRLARVILSDIRLYNREKIRTGGDLKPELAEGYALFRSRVTPGLLPLFKKVLADNNLRPAKAAAGPAPPAPAPRPAPRPAPAPPPPVRPAERRVQPPAPALAPRTVSVPAPEPIASPSASLPPRRGRIDSEEAARRLARVIVSDIKLYNPGRSAGDRDLTSQINDGRMLFRTRVATTLVPLFDDVLAGSGLVDGRGAPPEESGAAAEEVFEALTVAAPSPVLEEERTEPHPAPPEEVYDDEPAPARYEQRPAPEEDFAEPPTTARPPRLPAAPAPAAPARAERWRALRARVAQIPRPHLLAAVAAVAAVVALIYYLA